MTAAAAPSRSRSLAFAAMPGVFVFLWSTGFIGAKFGLPYIEPLTFLSLRFAIVIALLLALIVATGAPWPPSWRAAAAVSTGWMPTMSASSSAMTMAKRSDRKVSGSM